MKWKKNVLKQTKQVKKKWTHSLTLNDKKHRIVMLFYMTNKMIVFDEWKSEGKELRASALPSMELWEIENVWQYAALYCKKWNDTTYHLLFHLLL